MPPPLLELPGTPDELSETSVSVMFTIPLAVLKTPPPSPVAILLVILDLSIVIRFDPPTPPPCPPVLEEITESSIVMVPPYALPIPPPSLDAVLPEMVELLTCRSALKPV